MPPPPNGERLRQQAEMDRAKNGVDTPTPPPPLPEAPPPMETPPAAAAAATGTASSRLDMLVGGGGGGAKPAANQANGNGTPTKRVSFMNEDSRIQDESVSNERVTRLENVERDPNVSCSVTCSF